MAPPKGSAGPGLRGDDFSHYQSQAQFNAALPNLSWAALKATQGTGYTDPTFKSRWTQLGKQQQQLPLRIAYGFLTPGNGTAQANYLMQTVGINGKMPAGTRLALDFEGAALKSPQVLRDASNRIHAVTGQWPLVYASTSALSTVKQMAPQAAIWEANYSSPESSNLITQYSSKPLDQDRFNGTMQQLRAFAGYSN